MPKALEELFCYAKRHRVALLLLIPVGLYYLRFIQRPDGMTLYPLAAECLLKGQPLASCAPAFTYPPVFALLMTPFVFLPMWLRNVLWYAILISVTYASFRLCEYLVVQGLGMRFEGHRLLGLRIISLMLSIKFILSVLENQAYDVLVFFCILLGIYGLVEKSTGWASAGLATAAALKATPLLFFPYVLFRRGWKFCSVCFLFYLALSFLPDVFFSIQDSKSTYYGNWVRQVALQPFIDGSTGEHPRFWEGANPLNQSLRSFVYRFAVGSELSEYFLLMLYVVYALYILYAVSILIKSSRIENPFVLDGALLVISMLLLSPVSSKSHFVVLMLPYMVASAYMIKEPGLRKMMAPIVGLSFVLNSLTSRDLIGGQLSDLLACVGCITVGTFVLVPQIGLLVGFELRKNGNANYSVRS